MAEFSLPMLPGQRFDAPIGRDFRRTQGLSVVNGVPSVLPPKTGPGQARRDGLWAVHLVS